MANKTQLEEFISFLNHPKQEVRTLATEYIAGLTSSDDGKRILKQMNIIPIVCQLLYNDQTTTKNCLNTLINMSDDSELLILMIDSGLISKLMENLFNFRDQMELNTMLLCNLTTLEKGCVNLLQIGTSLAGLNFYKLIDLFIFSESNNQDSLSWIALILMNVVQIFEARSFIMNEERNILPLLLPFIQHNNQRRRKGVLGIVKNCCLQMEYHERLLSDKIDILQYLLHPIRGSEILSDEDMCGLHPSLYNSEMSLKKREMDKECCKLIIESLLALCSTRKSREILRAKKVYPILREYEKVEEDEGICDSILQIVEVLMLYDEPNQTTTATTTSPTQPKIDPNPKQKSKLQQEIEEI